MISRRRFVSSIAASSILPMLGAQRAKAIDRLALVRRHNPVVRQLDPLSPLSLGNGEFAFTADITGLQTFAEEYEQKMPLCTQSQWGWHTAPLPPELEGKTLRLEMFDTHGRQVGYSTESEGQQALFNYLRQNPHRLHLGRIGLVLRLSGGREAKAADLADIEQRLDLWTGTMVSRFRIEDQFVTVRTAVHPDLDLLAVDIESNLLATGRLEVRFAFPYGSPEMNAADWQAPDKHRTEIVKRTADSATLHRRLDSDEYFVALAWRGRATLAAASAHDLRLKSAPQTRRLAFVAAFSPRLDERRLPGFEATVAASTRHWRRFWSEGGAVELEGSSDRRAMELERRIVLSQYLTAIQCSGSMPPQETGLTVNSWYGKFHLEMHWWHAAHFALWKRTHLLERSLDYYATILPRAKELARSQGYTGARWPKMVGPEGRDSPSSIGPLLIWQQPHPISYAELCYQTHRNRRTLERFREVVFESAQFMASFAHLDQKRGRYVLGPPVIPAQENHPPRETWNPTFELAYWSYGLKIAQRWRERLGLRREPLWDEVVAKLSPLPVKDGVYLAHENCPETFISRHHDHPSMLGALGLLPGDGVDRETMRRTLEKTLKDWQWERTWGWDYPLAAMTAARLGEARWAVDALLLETGKNRYLPNGHNYQRENLPCYLPGNGGLLAAIALMAGRPQSPPLFPAPSWSVRAEQLAPERLDAP